MKTILLKTRIKKTRKEKTRIDKTRIDKTRIDKTKLNPVITMVLFLIVGDVCAQDDMALELDSEQVEMGKAINATLKLRHVLASGPEPDVEKLLQPLQLDYTTVINDHVIDLYRSKGEETRIHEHSWDISIFPRSKGQQQIPSLIWPLEPKDTNTQLVRTQAASIQVHASMNRSHKTEIFFIDLKKVFNPWQRQQIVLRYEILSTDKYISLDWDIPVNKNFRYFSLKHEKEPMQLQGRAYIRHSIGLILFPLTAGDQTLELPAIHYSKSGRVEYEYFPSPVSIKVKRLPVYINPAIPVGKLDIIAIPEKRWIYVPGQLYRLKLKLAAPVLSQWLPPVLGQMEKSETSLAFYPPEISHTDHIDKTLVGEKSYDFSFSAPGNGLFNLPALEFHFLDPHSGKLEQVRLHGTRVLVLSPIWLWVFSVFLALLASFIIITLFGRLLSFYKYRKKLVGVYGLLRKASTAQEILSAMRVYAGIRGWPQNISLGQWCDKYPLETEYANKQYHCLQKALYSREHCYSKDELQTIRKSLFPAPPWYLQHF